MEIVKNKSLRWKLSTETFVLLFIFEEERCNHFQMQPALITS